MRFYIDSDSGQIGPFWWINAVCQAHKITGIYGLMDNLSEHLVWRQGGCGWDFGGRFKYIANIKWRIIEALN
jgi:hypothetical protein